MNPLDTTNGRIERVLADLAQLIEWAYADAEASQESGSHYQAHNDQVRASSLMQAKQIIEGCRR